MSENEHSVIFQARASRAGYIVFGVLYSPMFAAFIYGMLNGRLHGQEHVILVPLLLLIPTYMWLLGFRIRFTPDRFEYRDGLWRWHSCPRKLIKSCELRWLEFRNFGRVLQFPRFVIQCGGNSQDRIVINPKPFSRETLRRVKELLGDLDERRDTK